MAGRLYGAASIVSGAMLLALAVRVYRIRDGADANKAAMQLFGFSILYLFVLFGSWSSSGVSAVRALGL